MFGLGMIGATARPRPPGSSGRGHRDGRRHPRQTATRGGRRRGRLRSPTSPSSRSSAGRCRTPWSPSAPLLWIGMPWLIARAGHSLRREVLARQSAQEEVEGLYHLLEQGLLPRQRSGHPNLRSATYFRPGEQRLRIGGDFFDLAVTADGSLAVVIGDVSGHGAEAGALSAKLRSAWRGWWRPACRARTWRACSTTSSRRRPRRTSTRPRSSPSSRPTAAAWRRSRRGTPPRFSWPTASRPCP